MKRVTKNNQKADVDGEYDFSKGVRGKYAKRYAEGTNIPLIPMRDRLQSARCARMLKALADQDRLKIVQCLQSGPKNVSQLSALLGRELANISHHLSVLRHARLVRAARRGNFVDYSLHPALIPANEAADGLDLGCCRIEWNEE